MLPKKLPQFLYTLYPMSSCFKGATLQAMIQVMAVFFSVSVILVILKFDIHVYCDNLISIKFTASCLYSTD